MVVVELNIYNKSLRIMFSGGNEPESPIRVKLKSMHEFLSLYNAAKEWWYKSSDNSDDIYAPYKGEVKKVFDRIVTSRSNINVNAKASLVPIENGSSKLIRFNSKGKIRLVKRKRNDKTTANGICVSDTFRDAFIEDCHKSGYDTLEITKTTSPYTYDKWSKAIDDEFRRQYLICAASMN